MNRMEQLCCSKFAFYFPVIAKQYNSFLKILPSLSSTGTVEHCPLVFKDPNPSGNISMKKIVKVLPYLGYFLPGSQLFFVYFELLVHVLCGIDSSALKMSTTSSHEKFLSIARKAVFHLLN